MLVKISFTLLFGKILFGNMGELFLKVLSWENLVKVGKILFGKILSEKIGNIFSGKIVLPIFVEKILEKCYLENFEYFTWEILLKVL